MSFRNVVAIAAALAASAGIPAAAVAAAPAEGAYTLSATSYAPPYAPTFTGNGLLGVRVPPAGQGYAPGDVPAQSELAGFYAKPPTDVQQRANIPIWSTLTFSDGGQPFSLSTGRVSGWRQTLDLHTGVITTRLVWTAPDGHVTTLSYQALTDRAAPNLGLVSLTLTPQWTGTARVIDALDPPPPATINKVPTTLTTQVTKGWNAAAGRDWLSVQTLGTGITAALASTLRKGPGVSGTPTPIDQSVEQAVGQQLDFPVSAGRTYTLTKYVGVVDSQERANPLAGAQSQSASGAALGSTALLRANAAAWAKLWQDRIDVLGDRNLGTIVNASEFYLWSSTRAGVDWSISPAGLSSNGYDGHIFWDAETWMYPSLLALHPDLAAGMNAYRYNRLAAAQQHARATGYRGARFPWESALDGTEQIPPPVSVNSEGLYEQHITADIALAQWQYFQTTGDAQWLRTRGWPVIQGAAQFWASRAVRGAGGRYHISHVTGPDEENPNVPDEAFTNAGARTTLQIAITAGGLTGQPVPPSWRSIAAGLVVPVKGGIHPEYAGYRNQLVKQADVTLLPYQWRFPMSKRVEQADLNFYVPRTDPGGPSMDDAVSSIDTAALGTPGCASFVFTQRSYEPFIRDPFVQFSETKTGGAFTFMTGIGGFLQEFIYGYSGLRWGTGGVALAPSLNAQLSGVTLRNLQWHGSTFTVSVGARKTTITLNGGPSLPVSTPSGRRTVTVGHAVQITTARPDLTRTADAVRCQKAAASTAEPGAPALAAVDGSPATDWQPTGLPATLTAPLHARARTITRATLVWGHFWPAQPKPNIHPKPRPVTTLSATSYVLQTSLNGHSWHTAISVDRLHRADVDQLRFTPVRTRYVRLRITAGNSVVTVYTNGKKAHTTLTPMLQELTVS
jgi:trehalose/maltose hydrolase-like predicted phosphorylase